MSVSDLLSFFVTPMGYMHRVWLSFNNAVVFKASLILVRV